MNRRLGVCVPDIVLEIGQAQKKKNQITYDRIPVWKLKKLMWKEESRMEVIKSQAGEEGSGGGSSSKNP